MESDFRHVAESIRREIEELLQKCGILFRAFGRGKTNQSITQKFDKVSGKYAIGKRLMQDAVGIRIAFYFFEDTLIVERLLKERYEIDLAASSIDQLKPDQFAVSRHNLIFRMPSTLIDEMQRFLLNRPIDFTFEVQLRSILSEGWHEVDHDLRYKCKENWNDQADLDRSLNGILATLETSEWAMKKIFDDLTYRHYKNRNWPAMLHNKFRMRTTPRLNENLCEMLSKEPDLAKDILRTNRSSVITALARATPKIPVNLENLLFIANCVGPQRQELLLVSPEIILSAIEFSKR